MLHIDGAIVVEGRYDKAKLKNIVDCPVITTDGFNIFKNKETRDLIKYYAANGGIIILTDSDRAGFIIRSHIKGIVSDGVVKNAYIPDISGKESRKTNPSKEGKLGVEGVPDSVIIEALKGFSSSGCTNTSRKITRMDLYDDGFFGKSGSSELRRKLSERFGLPLRLGAGALTEALNARFSYEQYRRAADEIISEVD